jgi:geranylgeranyl diphosphate synthase type II
MGNSAGWDLKTYLKERRHAVDRALESCLPPTGGPTEDLLRAMRYSLFAGGKRLRPILCMAGAAAVGGNEDDVLPVACALELIHTYSLIHDDLPAMDDDDLRRGNPTSHKVFGEAMAILAGDGLLTEAFHVISSPELAGKFPPGALLKAARMMAEAAGHRGMVGGQAVDIRSEGLMPDADTLAFIHGHKTAALIRASVLSGALLGGGTESQLRAIADYGQKTGLAFQISDDILDVEGDTEAMGKRAGADEKRGKMTYPALFGIERSKAMLSGLVSDAILSLQALDGSADPLRHIARYITERRT